MNCVKRDKVSSKLTVLAEYHTRQHETLPVNRTIMRTIRAISIFLTLAVLSCTNRDRHPVPKQQTAAFIPDSNELRVLSDSLCDLSISLDSLQSFSQYDSIKRDYYAAETNSRKTNCLVIEYMDTAAFKPRRIFIQPVPATYGLVATTIPPHSILHITAFNSTSVAGIVGNELYQGGKMPPGSLGNYIKRLFLNPPDSSKYGEKRVSFHLPDDSIAMANKYLTQLVIGYMAAQRELCKLKFGKPLKEATPKEIAALRSATPLRFKIVPIKTTAVIGMHNKRY